METKWLEDYLSLVDTRNFTRSAELRYTTQPAFSRRIKCLEEWVGATLLDRGTQPMSLTCAGEKFHPVAEEVLRRLYQVREDIRDLEKTAAGMILFGATHSLSMSFFPRWIRSIEDRSGVLVTRLDSNHAEECVQALLKGHCHFMLCHAHPSVELNLPPNEFTSIVVGHDRLVPVSAPAEDGAPLHRLDGGARPVHYLAYAESSAIGRAVENMLAHRPSSLHLERVFVTPLAAVLASMARAGRGLAWLPENQIAEHIAAGRLVVAGGPAWTIPVEIRLFRPKDLLPPRSEKFWSLLGDDAMPGNGNRTEDQARIALR
jgi:DNA-binding transcriptional LysR family regulator